MQPSRNSLALLVLVLGVLSAPAIALADSIQTQSFTAWRQMQDCAQQSSKQFPDHTPEGNAKREAARLECLRQHRLPVPAADPAPAPSR